MKSIRSKSSINISQRSILTPALCSITIPVGLSRVCLFQLIMPTLVSHKVINPNHFVHFHTCQTIIQHLAYLFTLQENSIACKRAHADTHKPSQSHSTLSFCLCHTVCDCIIAKNTAGGDHKMIMIRENFAKYRLMDLKFISYDTFQHSSVRRVLRSSLLLYR